MDKGLQRGFTENSALVALACLGTNSVSVAICPKTGSDILTGTNSCLLHFERDVLPPVMEYGFWSVTAYGVDNFLIDNELNRYAINDRNSFIFNGDGS